MKKNIFILVLLLGIITKINSQEQISRQEAINDIDFFFNQAEQIHPNLYFSISKDDLDKIISKEKENINDSISIDNFSKKMTSLVNLIGDGHTNVYMSKNLRNTYYKKKTQLPFEISIVGEEIFVKNPVTSQLEDNDNILSINNIPATELLKLKKLVIGDINYPKNKNIEKYFSYYLFMGYEFTDTVSLRIKRNGNKLTKLVKLAKKKEYVKRKKYSFTYISDSIGALTINSFSGIRKKQYLHFMDSVFADLKAKNIHDLIIDVRNNGGGNSNYGALLLPYINVEKYRFNQKYVIKTSKPEKKYLRKRFVKWYLYPLYPFAYFSKMGRILFFEKNGTLTELKLEDAHLKPVENSFNGNVYVLTSAHTYSAAADFVVAFNYANRGLVIGEAIGQPYCGFIDKIGVSLPNSKLQGGVSFKKYEYIGANKDNCNQGLKPDVNIDFEEYKEDDELNKKLIETITNEL